MARKSGLGRGLSALIPDGAADGDDDGVEARVPVTEVDIDRVTPNPHQPRTSIDALDLDALVASVREHGVIQPLLVSEVPAADGGVGYQLIAGERRLRAARAAGLTRVPVTVRQSTPRELLELALIENVQRLDLNPLEEAHAYQRLVDEFGLTQREVAERVGRSRTAVTNTLRLLDLPAEIHHSIALGEITEGHGRALLGLAEPEERRRAWRQVVERGLSVRQTEGIVRRWRNTETVTTVDASAAPAATVRHDPQVEALAEALRRSLGTKVTLRRTSGGSGSVTIHFYSDEELEGLLERLTGGLEL